MSSRRSSPRWALFAAEMRMLARDKRTLFASVLLPLLVMPLFFLLSSQGEKGREKRLSERVFTYAVIGQQAADARRLLGLVDPSSKPQVTLPETQGGTEDRIRTEDQVPAAVSTSQAPREAPRAKAAGSIRLIESQLGLEGKETLQALGDGEVHVVLQALSADQALELEAIAPSDGSSQGVASETQRQPLLRLYFTADWEESNTAVGELERRLRLATLERRDLLLEEAGFTLRRKAMARIVSERDVATAGERSGAAIGRWAPLFLMLFLIVGGSVVAADTLAGEKERGTLETLLTTAAGRDEIMHAKLLAIFAVGLLITWIQLLNISLYAGLRWIDLPPDFTFEPKPLALVCLTLLFVPFALFVSAVLLWVSGRSSTYKAFQISLMPLMLLLLAPTAASFLPGLDLRTVIAIVPIAGASVAIREILSGQLDLPFVALAGLATLSAAVLVSFASLRDLSSERLITMADRDQALHLGGPRLLERRVLRYFAGGWVLIFLSSAAFGFGLRGQVLFNLVAVFLGGSLLLMRKYRLETSQTLALRPVCPSVWAGVLLGAPATLLVGVAVARLSGRLFPLPQEALEALGKSIVPADMPLWELLFFVAVLPAICEEVAFRGVLLQTLRRRLSPLALTVTTAAIFAIFHIEWVRLLPTFFLGVILATLTLLTGSLLPAIVWHFLNNAAAILAERFGLDMASLPASSYAWAAGVAALSGLLIWRGRKTSIEWRPDHGRIQ